MGEYHGQRQRRFVVVRELIIDKDGVAVAKMLSDERRICRGDVHR